MTLPRGILHVCSLVALTALPAFAAPTSGAQRRSQFQPLRPNSAREAAPAQPKYQPPASIAEHVGRKVNHIDVSIAVLEPKSSVDIPRFLSVTEGSLFDTNVPTKVLAELESSGRFANAQVDIEPDGEGVRVKVKASERGISDFIGVIIDDKTLDRDTITREFGIAAGADFERDELAAATERVRQLLKRSGFPNSTIEATLGKSIVARRYSINLRIVTGPPTLLGNRYFYQTGTPASSLERFTSSYSVNKGDRVDEAALQDADTKLENALRAARYFDARVRHDVGTYEGSIALRVHIDTGARYELLLRGNTSIDNEALIAALDLESANADRNPAQFGERMAAHYRKRGFSDVKVKTAITGERTDAVRYVTLNFDEGVRTKVYSRSYPCLDTKEIAKLKGGGPPSTEDIGTEIDSFLEEELPGSDLFTHPHPVGADMLLRGQETKRAIPIELEASKAFDATTYDRAIEHVQELYRNEGYLHARVGPLNVVRATCKPGSGAGACDPIPLPSPPKNLCVYDQTGLPLASAPFPDNFTCVPNAAKGIRCSSRLDVVIPVKLGPQSILYDVSFTGVRAFSHKQLAREMELPYSDPINLVAIEAATRKLTDFYRTEGYAFAEAKYALEESDDHTHVRVRFDVNEGDLVYVRRVEIRGLNHTSESIVRRRVTLRAGLPFRGDDARATEDAISTLGPFTSVNVAMEDPFVVEREKTIVITVVERVPQYIEVRPGISTGEGLRAFVEYGHRNLFGAAIGLTARGQVSWLPNFAVPDSVMEGFKLACDQRQECDRIGRRATISLLFPEIGLGSLMRGQVDLVHARDIQRDFVLQKFSSLVTLSYRPSKNVLLSLTPSIENNKAVVYRADSIEKAITAAQQNATTDAEKSAATALGRLLRVPDGNSMTFAARALVSWDRRDVPLNAHRGTYFAAGVEFVNWYRILDPNTPSSPTTQGQFFRLTQTASAYLPLAKRVTLAFQLRMGQNVHLRPSQSTTYPDRMFFMGGFDSMRGWLQDSLMPYELDKQIIEKKITVPQVPLRGGDFMFNPRVELRFPIRSPVDAVVFGDFGNLWREASNVFEMPFKLRVAAGAGLRVVTPFGPLVLDYGVNLTRRTQQEYGGYEEDFGALQFAVGLF